ncbi:KPN_02809 family neutral zinc metallopeptidase [Pontixanthobacter aquaemixtae]|uniref:Zinc metalloprotease n=1 Tax=Pontixanthobacter aquaemixtae TaxID=1958940 RepID=A0A844ZUH8_9SPHN|nr:neutral zinc metallopeptidase [Pontixanthobacter aquaemixtae]MXO90447.1 zinc metalloprotease [Pontixanthobacter aquaemixtae]
MRLNRFNPNSIRVEDQRGGRFPGGGGGKVGCGTIIIAIIAALVFGVDPAQMIGALDGGQQPGITQSGQAGRSTEESCAVNQYSQESCAVLASLNETWQPEFEKAGIRFGQPKLVFYGGRGRSGCGAAQSAMGPFYCPADQGIYIDTSFYDTMAQRMGAGGDFARYYVMAHEYGHHIQYLTGIAGQVRSAQQQNPRGANQLQVRMELQADCYAGVWAGKNRHLIEAGDMEEGLRAAASIGDDTLQRNAGQRVRPESFTHGSSAQRMEALKIGMQSGDDTRCDAYFDMR